MSKVLALVIITALPILGGFTDSVEAQQPQIPTLQVCNITAVTGTGFVKIARRSDAVHLGTFTVQVGLKCDPRVGYPVGSLTVKVDMSDSIAQGSTRVTTLEQACRPVSTRPQLI